MDIAIMPLAKKHKKLRLNNLGTASILTSLDRSKRINKKWCDKAKVLYRTINGNGSNAI